MPFRYLPAAYTAGGWISKGGEVRRRQGATIDLLRCSRGKLEYPRGGNGGMSFGYLPATYTEGGWVP